MILPSQESHFPDEDSQSKHYDIMEWGNGAVCHPRITVRWGPVDDHTELEVSALSNLYWTFARDWFRERYGQAGSDNPSFASRSRNDAQPFRFMDLPRELRDGIIKHLVGQRVWPHISSSCCSKFEEHCLSTARTESNMPGPERLSIHAPRTFIHDHSRLPEDSHPGSGLTPKEAFGLMNMLLVSKQFRSETLQAMLGPTFKRFNDVFVLYTVITRLVTMPMSTFLNKVSLSFTNVAFFNFVGYRSYRGVGFSPIDPDQSCQLKHLVEIVSPLPLHLHLQFQLRKPITYVEDDMSIEDPWHGIGQHSMSSVSCQKVVVDWLLTLAYEHLSKVNKISLAGHVKNSVRRRWEEIFSYENAKLAYDAKNAADVELIKSTQLADLYVHT